MRLAAQEGRGLPFAVERRADGAVLGLIGVGQNRTDSRRGSLRYGLGESHHGQGTMREAAPATVAADFARLELDVIEAGAQPGNTAPFAVMRAYGMRRVRERDVFAAAQGAHVLRGATPERLSDAAGRSRWLQAGPCSSCGTCGAKSSSGLGAQSHD